MTSLKNGVKMVLMKKKSKLFDDVIGVIFVIGILIFLAYLFLFIDKLTFIPNISFCDSNPILLCDIPILGRIVKILDLQFIIGMSVFIFLIWLIIYLSEKFKKKK